VANILKIEFDLSCISAYPHRGVRKEGVRNGESSKVQREGVTVKDVSKRRKGQIERLKDRKCNQGKAHLTKGRGFYRGIKKVKSTRLKEGGALASEGIYFAVGGKTYSL